MYISWQFPHITSPEPYILIDFLISEKIQLDVTKASEVREIAKKHANDSQLLVHISPLERVIYVLAKDNSKHGSVVHQIKVLVTLFIHTHIIYSFLACGNFCLLITFANSLDQTKYCRS